MGNGSVLNQERHLKYMVCIFAFPFIEPLFFGLDFYLTVDASVGREKRKIPQPANSLEHAPNSMRSTQKGPLRRQRKHSQSTEKPWLANVPGCSVDGMS